MPNRRINKPLAIKKYVANPKNWNYKEIGLLLWKSYIEIEKIIINKNLTKLQKEQAIFALPQNNSSYHYYFYTQKNNPEQAEKIKEIRNKWVENLRIADPEKYRLMRQAQSRRHYEKKKAPSHYVLPHYLMSEIPSIIKNTIEIAIIKNKEIQRKLAKMILICSNKIELERYNTFRYKEGLEKAEAIKVGNISNNFFDKYTREIKEANKKQNNSRKEWYKERYIKQKQDKINFKQNHKTYFAEKSQEIKDTNITILKQRLARLKLMKLLYIPKTLITPNIPDPFFKKIPTQMIKNQDELCSIDWVEPKSTDDIISKYKDPFTYETIDGQAFYVYNGKRTPTTECIPEIDCPKAIHPLFNYKSYSQKYVEDNSFQTISRNGYTITTGKLKYNTPDFVKTAIKKYCKVNKIEFNATTFSSTRTSLFKTKTQSRWVEEYQKFKKYKKNLAKK